MANASISLCTAAAAASAADISPSASAVPALALSGGNSNPTPPPMATSATPPSPHSSPPGALGTCTWLNFRSNVVLSRLASSWTRLPGGLNSIALSNVRCTSARNSSGLW
jgi:hypothetical protein